MVKDTDRVEDNAICFAGQVVLDNHKAQTTHKALGTMLKKEVANCFTKVAGLMGQVCDEAATFKVGNDLINWETDKPFLRVNEARRRVLRGRQRGARCILQQGGPHDIPH